MSGHGLWCSFLGQVERQPTQTALVWHRQETSYAELHELAHQARARLDHLDLADDEALGLLAPKSPESVALVLACLMSGRRFLLPSPSLAQETLDTLFAQAGCRHVVQPESTEVHPVTRGTPTRAVEQCDTSFMLCTSGSTGLPKIVPLTAGGVDRFVWWASDRFGIGPGRSVLNYAPLNFDLCLLDVWTTLARGGTVVLADPDLGTNGAYLQDLIADNAVDVVQAVPMFYRLLLDSVAHGTSFDSVKHVMFTGDAIPAKTLAELPSLFPQARLHNVYGCTETNDSFVHSFTADDPVVTEGAPVPLGDPLPGVDYMLVDDDGGVLRGAGVGELWVRTPFQTDGYLDTSRNADKFVRHPLVSHNRKLFFRSGDLVQRDDDGNLLLQGRNDFLVKVRGVGVNTAEVERVLLDHEDVVEAAVIAVPDPVAGRRLHSVVRRRANGGRLNSLNLRLHCAQHLPQAAIPTGMEITDDPLPKTSTGKVDRKLVEFAYATRETQKES